MRGQLVVVVVVVGGLNTAHFLAQTGMSMDLPDGPAEVAVKGDKFEYYEAELPVATATRVLRHRP